MNEETKTNLVEKVRRDILKYISTHSEEDGLMKEQNFATMFGVSRVVVREALSSLRALGLIETKRKSGTRIISPDIFGVVKTMIEAGALSKETMKDLYELRLMLEVGASDFIFRGRTPEYLNTLDSIIETETEHSIKLLMSEGNEDDYESAQILLDKDMEFHKVLMQMTGNKSLIDFQEVLSSLFCIYKPKVRKDFFRKDIVTHNSLYKILQYGNADEFRMAMHLHLFPLIKNEDSILEKE